MNLKKILALLLASLMLISMIACSNGGDTPAESTEAPSAESVDESPIFVPTVLDITKGGESEFVIIYPQNADQSTIQIAMRLQEAISDYTGASVAVKSDMKLDPNADTSTAFEILIGDTNRAETAEVLGMVEGSKDYAVAVCGNKLVIVGNSVSATVNGVYYFINKVISVAEIKDGNFSVSSENNYYYVAVYPVQDFKILGNSPKEYKIVIPVNADYGVERFALRIQYLIATRTGFSMDIAKDTETSDYEILVGRTSRTATAVAENEYAIAAKGNRVELIADALYSYEYMYDYCSNKLCGLLKDGKADAGVLCRTSVVDSIKADKIESVLDKQGELRFMSFNILGEDNGSYPMAPRSRMVAAMVAELQPDILCLQEYTEDAQKSYNYPLADSLAALGYGIADGGKVYNGAYKIGTPIFYRTDVFTLLASDSVAPTQASYGEWITSAVLKRNSDQRVIGIVNIHPYFATTAEGNALRVIQVGEAIAVAKDIQAQYNCDILMTGDFNAYVNSDPVNLVLQRGFKMVQQIAAVSDNDSPTLHDDPVYNVNGGFFEHPKEAADAYNDTAIDHTFYLGNGLELNRMDVLTDVCSRSVSDHAATVIDFDLNGYTAPEPVEPWTDEYTKNY